MFAFLNGVALVIGWVVMIVLCIMAGCWSYVGHQKRQRERQHDEHEDNAV